MRKAPNPSLKLFLTFGHIKNTSPIKPNNNAITIKILTSAALNIYKIDNRGIKNGLVYNRPLLYSYLVKYKCNTNIIQNNPPTINLVTISPSIILISILTH